MTEINIEPILMEGIISNISKLTTAHSFGYDLRNLPDELEQTIIMLTVDQKINIFKYIITLSMDSAESIYNPKNVMYFIMKLLLGKDYIQWFGDHGTDCKITTSPGYIEKYTSFLAQYLSYTWGTPKSKITQSLPMIEKVVEKPIVEKVKPPVRKTFSI